MIIRKLSFWTLAKKTFILGRQKPKTPTPQIRGFRSSLLVNFATLTLIAISAPSLSADSCKEQPFEIVVLGSGGPEINDGRASSGYLIRENGESRFLVDFGSGSGFHFEKAKGNINQLAAVFFTHFHVDHSADFPALIKAAFFVDRTTDLPVYGPSGNKLVPDVDTWIKRLFGKNTGAFSYLSKYIEADARSEYKIVAKTVPANWQEGKTSKTQIAGFNISSVAVSHAIIPSVSWRFEKNGCSVVFSGDTNNKNKTLDGQVKNADLFFANMAIPETESGAALNLHMLPSEIGRIAAQGNVKKLVLTHIMNRTAANLDESINFVKNSYLGDINVASDGAIITLPK